MATARLGTAGLRVPFTPNVEEIDENEAHILRLQLPEFKRQQVKVRVQEGKRVVKVTGGRQAGDNRWFRFDETYPIPEICLIDKISVKLKDGFLSITMLKQTTGPVSAPPTPVATVAVNDSVRGDSGVAKTSKDSKTEDVGEIKNEETAKIGAGTPCPRATRVGRMSVPAMVSLAAAVVIAVAAYFVYLIFL